MGCEITGDVAVSVSLQLPKPLKWSLMGSSFFRGTRLSSTPWNFNLISGWMTAAQHDVPLRRGLRCWKQPAPPLSTPEGETRRERTAGLCHDFKQSEWDSGGKWDDVKSQRNSWREGEEPPETRPNSLQNKSTVTVCSLAGREYQVEDWTPVINVKVIRV